MRALWCARRGVWSRACGLSAPSPCHEHRFGFLWSCANRSAFENWSSPRAGNRDTTFLRKALLSHVTYLPHGSAPRGVCLRTAGPPAGWCDRPHGPVLEHVVFLRRRRSVSQRDVPLLPRVTCEGSSCHSLTSICPRHPSGKEWSGGGHPPRGRPGSCWPQVREGVGQV